MSEPSSRHAVYGTLPSELSDIAEIASDAAQCSPRHPGSLRLDDFAAGSLNGFVMHAPGSTLERRHELALMLRALKPGAAFVVLASNSKGGNRLVAELGELGCPAQAAPKRHHQIVRAVRPAQVDDDAIAHAIAAGGPRLVDDLGLWSQPGIFSWDRIDPGSALLLDHLPPLAGRGADLGCGIGVLSRKVVADGACQELTAIDIDGRAIDMARRNLPDGAPVAFLWRDVRQARDLPSGLDFVVMNPPFHDGGTEDRGLGRTFIDAAARMLKPGGALWMTANRQLAYEATLKAAFESSEQVVQEEGYKIVRAVKGRPVGAVTVAARERPDASRGRRSRR